MTSTPAWLNDAAAAALPANNGGAFNGPIDPAATMLDPSMAFLQNPAGLDLTAFPQPGPSPAPQALQNGAARNASPAAFQNPAYQVPSVVPSKRPRPREDGGLAASPHQAPGGLPGSRSQTPLQVPYQGQAFPNAQHAPQSFPQASTYGHLQQQGGSANASPSPVMPSQQFRPPGPPQRVQTASPSPFPQPGQNLGAQLSPAPSDQVSRGNTPLGPQPGAGFMQGMPYSPSFAQQYSTPPNMTSAPPQNAIMAQQAQQAQQVQQAQNMLQQQQQQQQQNQQPNAQRMYQMRLQQQLQQCRLQNSAVPGTIQPQIPQQMGNGMRPQQPQQPQQPPPPLQQQPMARPNNPEQFVKSVAQFMHQRGMPFNMSLIVGERPVSLMQLYAIAMRLGGSKKVTMTGAWPTVAMNLQLPPQQYPTATQELKDYFEKNLAPYEDAWIQTQQRQKAMQQQQQQQQQQQLQGGVPAGPPQMSPPKPANMPHPGQQSPPFTPHQQPPSQQPLMQQQQQQQQQQLQFQQQQQQQMLAQQAAMRQTPPQPGVRQGPPNGYPAPQQNQMQNRQQGPPPPQRLTANRQPEATPPPGQPPAFPSPSVGPGSKSSSMGALPGLPPPQQQDEPAPPVQNGAPQISKNYSPRARTLEFHGGTDVEVAGQIGSELLLHKPNVPSFLELGVIDIHALTMSLQSGIHAEVRMALDTVATLSVENRFQLHLQSCEDLVEVLVDCADAQVELLAENTAEVSDVMLISAYEDVMRGCRAEVETIQEVPAYGTVDYELDRAVERLLCVTTIMRNLSFFENNHELLADTGVVRFLCGVIRYLGTRNMLLRTHNNTLDFMKDIIIYLSNLAQAIELPGKEEALCLLHFLLSFAPCPPPTTPGSEAVMFSPYLPSVHRYLPPAVDSLAKLLARDDPNRAFYKELFAADCSSSPPYDLLTRAFALAISPIPENAKGNVMPSVEARKPYLVQGMLAAEILANMAPGHERGLARSWLASEDGFALSLLRLVCLLSTDRGMPPVRGRPHEPDAQSYFPITHRGIAVLRRLAEKARNPEDGALKLPVGLLPKRESLLGALLTQGIDGNVVTQLCAYAGLDE